MTFYILLGLETYGRDDVFLKAFDHLPTLEERRAANFESEQFYAVRVVQQNPNGTEIEVLAKEVHWSPV